MKEAKMKSIRKKALKWKDFIEFHIVRPELQTNFDGVYSMTKHATQRVIERGLTPMQVENALTFGHIVEVEAGFIVIVDDIVLQNYSMFRGIRSSRGVQVVLASDGAIKTVIKDTESHRMRRLKRPRSNRVRPLWDKNGLALLDDDGEIVNFFGRRDLQHMHPQIY